MIFSALSNSSNLNLPNSLSLIRGVFAIIIPFLLLSAEPMLHLVAVVLFALGAITDYLDGYFARKYNLITSLGKFIDPITDKMLILIPLCLLGSKGFCSMFLVVIITFRELAVTFMRFGWLINSKVVAAERLGKWKFGFQAGTVLAGLLYVLTFDFVAMEPLNGVFGSLLSFGLVVASVLTVVSGVQVLQNNRSIIGDEPFAKYVAAFGVGLFPVAPGTWGSLATIPVIMMTSWNFLLYAGALALTIWLGHWAVKHIDLSQSKDPGYITLDEVAGMLVTFLFIPLTPLSLLVGFLLFRVFDIIKPFPLRRLEKFPKFWGILWDDIGAGVYAWIIMAILFLR